MKILYNISITVLLCLFLAAPANAAESSIYLTVPTSTYLGSSVTATVTVSGEVSATRKYGVAFLHAETPVTDCGKAVEKGSASVTMVYAKTTSSSSPLEESVALPLVNYEALGTYTLCAYVQREAPTPAEATASFTVVVPPPPPTVTPPAPPTPSAPVVTVPVPVVPPAPIIHTLTTAQKLRTALAKCKKLKKHSHSKRVQCERTAKKKVRH
jgi:hypothetical protein